MGADVKLPALLHNVNLGVEARRPVVQQRFLVEDATAGAATRRMRHHAILLGEGSWVHPIHALTNRMALRTSHLRHPLTRLVARADHPANRLISLVHREKVGLGVEAVIRYRLVRHFC